MNTADAMAPPSLHVAHALARHIYNLPLLSYANKPTHDNAVVGEDVGVSAAAAAAVAAPTPVAAVPLCVQVRGDGRASSKTREFVMPVGSTVGGPETHHQM